ncbi:hypothetical protein KGF57_002583 [Candida theae]|uniref:Uncharacterized protein n=1 Tax=Candida theae TaxID=1198502 RepID=A0AAD5FYG7_9ASCO|nr:uncharacterized protein KGF57_002583 [Candida theae]KAI5958228.1 hypothetical protein KGF57_002583 [Candida theae]
MENYDVNKTKQNEAARGLITSCHIASFVDSTSIPTFDPTFDSINLQVKSLLYLFKRLRINKLSPLVKNGQLTYLDSNSSGANVDDADPTFTKLDRTYNVSKFEELLLDDEYRVLVDYIKNKFRSLCFLNEVPFDNSDNYSSPSDGFPPFLDYKKRKSKYFKFTLFPIEQPHTTESIARILSGSTVYSEHKVPSLKRYNIALTAITKAIGKPSIVKFTISQDEKTRIIRNYLTLLATHVQVMRLYDEYTKLHPLITTSTNTLEHSTLKLPLNDSPSAGSTSSSPTKVQPSTSLTKSSSSPTKLAKRAPQSSLTRKPSIPKLRLEELNNPVTNPPKHQYGEKVVFSSSSNAAVSHSDSGSGSATLSEDVEGEEILRLDLSSNPEQILKPSAKTQVSSNPADILTQNDILMHSTKPQNYIESIKSNGFHLSNNYFVTSPDSDGDLIGLCLLGSETFEVKLTNSHKSKSNSNGKSNGKSKRKEVNFTLNDHIVTFAPSILQIFSKIHPKPELLVIGLGKKTSRLLNPENRQWFSSLGIQLEVSDSTNAGQIYDLLSTERPGVTGALLLPPNL